MSRPLSVAVINGPNLAGLGMREPDIYGSSDQQDLVRLLEDTAGELGLSVAFGQFDGEGEIIAAIWDASKTSDGLVINPGGYSHYSVAILDALRSFTGPVVEVHISQVFAREPFRCRLVTAAGASALIAGAGLDGYRLALRLIKNRLEDDRST
jgi:3-dehydroquinate dehydratase-2